MEVSLLCVVAVRVSQGVWVWYLRVCVCVCTRACASCVCLSACERARARACVCVCTCVHASPFRACLYACGYVRTRVCACDIYISERPLQPLMCVPASLCTRPASARVCTCMGLQLWSHSIGCVKVRLLEGRPGQYASRLA